MGKNLHSWKKAKQSREIEIDKEKTEWRIGAWRVQGMEIAPFLQEVETKTKASHRKKEL